MTKDIFRLRDWITSMNLVTRVLNFDLLLKTSQPDLPEVALLAAEKRNLLSVDK